MLFTPETIQIPMMSGDTVPCDVQRFKVPTAGGLNVTLAVRKVSERLCYILHYRTGLKISAEHTGNMREAAKGYALSVEVGAVDLVKLHHVAKSHPEANKLPEGVYA